MPAPTRTLERPPSARDPGTPAIGGRGPDGTGGDALAGTPATTPARIAVWLLVGAITVLFAAFTSTYLVRRGEADWRVGALPPVVWVTTGVLLGGSVALEGARRHARRVRLAGPVSCLTLPTLVG